MAVARHVLARHGISKAERRAETTETLECHGRQLISRNAPRSLGPIPQYVGLNLRVNRCL